MRDNIYRVLKSSHESHEIKGKPLLKIQIYIYLKARFHMISVLMMGPVLSVWSMDYKLSFEVYSNAALVYMYIFKYV